VTGGGEMADFKDFWENLKKGLEDLGKKSLSEFQKEAEKDGRAFFKKTKKDLQRWTRLLARGELTREDFEWLVKSKKDLAEMEALKQAGLTLAKVEKFQNTVVSLVIDSAFKTFV
jgi:hypothetical protein